MDTVIKLTISIPVPLIFLSQGISSKCNITNVLIYQYPKNQVIHLIGNELHEEKCY